MELGGGKRGWAWGVGLLVLLRLVYLAEYVELPFLFGPLFDSSVYLAQADAVREGHFGSAVLLAFSPLYGYLLAALGARADSALLVVWMQFALGVGNVCLIHGITRRLFDARAAFWAALCFALYGPLLFFETKIMSETLGLTLLLLGIRAFAGPDLARNRPLAIVVCGLCLGLAVLARASLLFCLPAFVLAALMLPSAQTNGAPERTGMTPRAASLRRSLGLAAVLSALLCGHGTFTYAHSGLFVPVILTSNTAAQATQGEWTGSLATFQEGAQAVGAWSVVRQAEERLRAVRQGVTPPPAPPIQISGWLRQVPHKLWLTFRDRETTFDYGYYGERSEVPVLCATFVSFGFLASAGAVGVFLCARARNRLGLWALAPVVIGILVTTTLFHPSTRYRLPLVVALAPLSGFAISKAWETARAGKPRLLALIGALALGWTAMSSTRVLSHPGMWHLRVAESAALASDLPECRARVDAAQKLEPNSSSVRERVAYVGSILPPCVAGPAR